MFSGETYLTKLGNNKDYNENEISNTIEKIEATTIVWDCIAIHLSTHAKVGSILQVYWNLQIPLWEDKLFNVKGETEIAGSGGSDIIIEKR